MKKKSIARDIQNRCYCEANYIMNEWNSMLRKDLQFKCVSALAFYII